MPVVDASLPLGRTLLVCLIAYALGCLNTGYYLVRLRTGQDIRLLGSGNAGARNVGRVLGKRGFALTLLGDVLKGSLAVAIARWWELPPVIQVLAALAVVAGHVWPLQLHGHGGKGAATAFGAILALHIWLGVAVLATAAVVYVLTRAVMLSGFVAMALAPFYTWWLLGSAWAALGIGMMALILFYAHRENLRALVRAAGSHR